MVPCRPGLGGAMVPRSCDHVAQVCYLDGCNFISFVWYLLGSFSSLRAHFLCFEQPGEEPCPIDPWIVVPDKSKYVDQQTLKLQENPEVCFLIQDLFLSFGYPTIVHLCFQIYYELLFMM